MRRTPINPTQIPTVDKNGKMIHNAPKQSPIFLKNFTRLKSITLVTMEATPIEKKINKPILEIISIADAIIPNNSTIKILLIFLIFSPPLMYIVYHFLLFNPIMNLHPIHQTKG